MRQNITTIAEILIDRMNDLDRTANRIEKASKQELKIDVSELKILLEKQKKEGRNLLGNLERISGKNKSRIPNWILGILIGSFIVNFACIFYVYSQHKNYTFLERKSEHFEKAYLQLKDEK